MTSNGDHSTSTSTAPSSILTNARDDHSNHPPSRPATTAASPKLTKPTPGDKILNGENHVDDDANLSEAETVVLEKHEPTPTKLIKTERSEDDLRSIKEESRVPSPARNGSKSVRDDFPAVNGVKHGSDPDVKSSVPTSPSSRTASRHTKDTSPAGSARSPVYSTTSPPQPTGRGRSASTLDSRKRKVRDDSYPKGLEPPRQKVKTEILRDSRLPNSPTTPGIALPHKRSQSTQSLVTGAAARRRRELAVSTERKQWSDESSGDSSSPHPAQTPNMLSHTRLKRSGHRALTSPARAIPHARKLDKYGATQLSRESERGNLSAVEEAYEAAPEELDHADFAGFTPLQKASLHGWADVVKYLIAKGCRTDCESLNRDTPLIDAVENGHLDVVRLLLNEGRVNPHHQNKKGQRAIDVLDNEVDDAEDIEKELHVAMRRHVDTSTNDDHTQSRMSQTKSASRLLYNEYNTETLVEKAGDGDILAVGELINSNIKPNIACGVAASRGGHYDILSILLASGLKADPDPSKHSETPMLVAIGRGHLKIVNLLLEQDNFDPTRRNRDGKTYYEISEDRRGPKWQEEKDILKNAFDNYKHKSPKRTRKEPSMASTARFKRKLSPRRERSSSPRTEPKRTQSTKGSSAPQKPRRLMSGKEMANREVKRRRRVVDEETSDDDDSEDEVRAPTKKSAKPRAMSEGEEHKPVKKIKVRSEEQDVTKRAPRAASHESDHDRRPKPGPKIKTRVERVSSGKQTPDADSLDEKKPMKSKIRSRPLDDVKVKKRRTSDVSVDDARIKKTPTMSAKSTPAPPEKASTPDVVARERKLEERKQEERKQEERKQEEQKQEEQKQEERRKEERKQEERREEERKQEEQKQTEQLAAEAKRKAAEEAAQKRAEEEKEQATRKAAEEEARRKVEAEAEAQRIANEEAEKARQREAEEAQRKAEEEEVKRKEALEQQRRKKLAERQDRLANLPRALRRACELGHNRPLHFSGEELGISAVFLPLFYTTSEDLQHENSTPGKVYIPSFQIAGILGLRELDLAQLDAPYSSWDRIPFTHKHRDLLLRQYDVALLAQDFRFPMEGTPDFDYVHIQESIKEARQQFMNMEGLYWVADDVLYPEVEKVESLQPLLEEIKDTSKRRRIHLIDHEAQMPEKKHKPRKSFMDTVLARNGMNGILAKAGDGS